MGNEILTKIKIKSMLKKYVQCCHVITHIFKTDPLWNIYDTNFSNYITLFLLKIVQFLKAGR